jgi:type II secretory pathway component PulL
MYIPNSSQASVIVINDFADDDMAFESPKKDIKLNIKRSSDEIIEELNAQLRDSVSLKSKKISKDKNSLNIRLMNKKPSKKNRS